MTHHDSCTVFCLCVLVGITAVDSISSSDSKWRGGRRPNWMADLVRALHESAKAIGSRLQRPKTTLTSCLVMLSTMTSWYGRVAKFGWPTCKPHRATMKGSLTAPGWRPMRNSDRPSSSNRTCTNPSSSRSDCIRGTRPVQRHGAFLWPTTMAIRSFANDKIGH